MNEGLTLYFLFGPDSQKAGNLARDDRVSLTIEHDTPDLMAITGRSMAHARKRSSIETKCSEANRILGTFPLNYAENIAVPIPMPTPEDARIFRVKPTIISVLD